MASCKLMLICLVHISLFLGFCFADDPYVTYNFEVSYINASPLGVPQQVIAINGKFPGPTINVTTNNNVVVNVRNKLDEDLLMTWAGIQQRRSSWQDGVLGTNCPIPSKWNWTYQFQVKDQIGSFFYFPSTNFQRAAGGYGGFIINNRPIIPIPFATPDGDIVILIGDWYKKNHTDLRKTLNGGKDLGMPDGVLINGKGPYRYNDTLVPEGIDYETINVHPGKTYRIRVHNVGISTSLNFRIQNHNLLLAETEGSYTVQQNYTSLDIHVGQWNVTASGARPNPQGSFRYGSINVTQVYVLKNKPPETIDGKRRTTLNGISFVNPNTPIKLADAYHVKGVYKLDFPTEPLTGDPKMETSVINGTYRGFMEIILQNNDTKVQTFHLNGYAFFVVGMDYGEWSENSRGTYNKWDGIARSTTQNTNKTELPVPDNALYCGALSKMQKPQDISSAAAEKSKLLFTLLLMLIVMLSVLC
ncbi:Multicopper oxidase, N-terminal [Dillenia turbinata]|uniref:Multicopper oxidase, N-terminal n=1 Tax=Dillenia turbinata TaxID=194707 RepID=A0AAN8ZRP9_9MAGN